MRVLALLRPKQAGIRMSSQSIGARNALVQLIDLDEAERRHVAHVLHSEIGQNLTAALLSLQFFAEDGLPADEIQGVADSIREALHQVRALSLQLRPPLLDEIGLGAALHSSLEQISLRRGFSVKLDASEATATLPAWLAIGLFRWVQALAERTPAGAYLYITLHTAHPKAETMQVAVALTDAELPAAWKEECAARACVLGAHVDYQPDRLVIRWEETKGQQGS